MDLEILQLDWIQNFFINSTSNPYPEFRIMDFNMQSKSKTAHSVAHLPIYLVVFILPHEAKVAAILPLVRHDWLKWSLEKYDTHKKTRVRVQD